MLGSVKKAYDALRILLRLQGIAKRVEGNVDKFKSRKFWAAIVGGVLALFAKELGLTSDQVQWLVTIAVGYIFGQGFVDGVQYLKK